MRIGSFVKSIVAATALLGFVAAAPSAAFACGVFPTGFNASDGVLAMVANGSSQVTLTSQGNAGSSRQGMLFYNRTTNSLYVCDGSVWQRLWGRGTDAAFNPASIGTGLYGGTFLQTSTGTNDNATALTFGYNTSGTVGTFPAAGIYVQTGAAYGSRMFFGTTNSFGSVLNRMTIDQNGNVGIATTAPASRFFVQETGDVRQLVVRDWADISASSGGQALFAANMYRGGLTNDFRYANTHASIGATGIAINHPAWRDISFISDGTANPSGATTLNTTFTPTTNMVIKTNGNVGIGTASPTSPLEVVTQTGTQPYLASSYFTGAAGANFIGQKARGTLAAPAAIAVDDQLAVVLGKGYTSAGAFSGNVGAIGINAAEAFTGTGNGTYISLATTAIGATARAERMRIDASGNVGIGTTSPIRRLTLSDTASTEFVIQASSGGVNLKNGRIRMDNNGKMYLGKLSDDGSTGTDYITLDNSNGSVGIGTSAPVINSTGTALHVHQASTSASAIHFTNTSTGVAAADGLILGRWSDGINYLWSYENETLLIGTNNAAQMTILGNGNIGIGSTPSYKLDVNGAINAASGVRIASISTSGTAAVCRDGTLYLTMCSSDARLKKDITSISVSGLDTILKLRPVNFHWKKDASQKLDAGFIAQEVQKVIPEAIGVNDADGLLTFNVTPIVSYSVKAIQELQAENTALKAQLEAMDARLKALESK